MVLELDLAKYSNGRIMGLNWAGLVVGSGGGGGRKELGNLIAGDLAQVT